MVPIRLHSLVTVFHYIMLPYPLDYTVVWLVFANLYFPSTFTAPESFLVEWLPEGAQVSVAAMFHVLVQLFQVAARRVALIQARVALYGRVTSRTLTGRLSRCQVFRFPSECSKVKKIQKGKERENPLRFIFGGGGVVNLLVPFHNRTSSSKALNRQREADILFVTFLQLGNLILFSECWSLNKYFRIRPLATEMTTYLWKPLVVTKMRSASLLKALMKSLTARNTSPDSVPAGSP